MMDKNLSEALFETTAEAGDIETENGPLTYMNMIRSIEEQ